MEELPDHRFAADQIAVRFHPHSALNLPLARRDGGADLPVQRRIVFLHKRIVLCGGGAENIVGILFHQGKLGTVGPGAFADGLADRPQPAGVDVGMADRVGGHHRRGGGDIKDLFQNGAGGCRIAGRVVIGVCRFADPMQKTAAPEIVLRKSLDQRAENQKIQIKMPDLPLEHRKRTVDQRSGKASLRMLSAQFLLLLEDQAEQPVCRAFDPELQLFPRGMRSFEKIAVLGIPIREGAGVGQSVDGCAFRVEDQSLPAEIRQKGDLSASKVFRHRSCDVEPGALPVFSPFLTPVQRLVGEGEAIRKFHRILTARVFTLQIDLLGIDFLFDPVAKHVRTAPVKFDFFWKHAENPLVQN